MYHRHRKGFEKHILPGQTYVGELTAGGDIRIDGTVRGTVTTPRKVVIGPEGRVDATLRAGEIVVAGELRGKVEATSRLHLLDGARFHADAVAGVILIEEGAVCQGSVRLRSRRPDGRIEEVICAIPAKRSEHADAESAGEASPGRAGT